MKNIINVRSAIYEQFNGSSAGPAHFFRSENADAYAAYYTSMYLIADTGEAIFVHMDKGFSKEPMVSYLEFWGVMQAIFIQQDAILEIYKAVIGNTPDIRSESPWGKLRQKRNLCAGHPVNKSDRKSGIKRTFMGRSFGDYESIRYELWDANEKKMSHETFNLRQMINDYDVQASDILNQLLSTMKANWP